MATEAAISTVVQLLSNMLVQDVSLIRGVKGKVESLKNELNRMQAFLTYANKKQAQDERVRNWISEIREVAEDAADTIEMFNLNENSRKRKYGFISSYFDDRRIGEEIRSIHAKLDAIDKSRERYGIKYLADSGERPVRSEVEARRRLAPCHRDEHLVGREDDVQKLLQLIMDEDKKCLSTTAVEGMGGIGKSTLAREIYNHPDVVSGRFNCRGWVVVSSEFTPNETIKQLILETSTEQPQRIKEIKELEEGMRDELYIESKLKEMLHRQLKGKRYFIVLDDVWKKEDWDSIMSALPNEHGKTSRLLLTTRIKAIANQCQSFHEMKFLDPEKSWELFLKKGLVIGNSNEEFPKEIESIGREIVEKCKGLPLSITLMGGLLAEKRNNREWEEALEELNSHLESGESSVSIILEAILELSYQDLSWKLKCCFLCLAYFEEDATIPVKRLLHIMVGQVLIQQTGRKTPEEIARGYLDELINRNLVQVKDLTFDNRVKRCHLHDSLHRICLKKAMEERGLVILKRGCRISSTKKIRHCIVEWDDFRSLSMNQKKPIHSLVLRNVEGEIKESDWNTFQLLKTLEFVGHNFSLQRLPDSFGLLLGLKQLRIDVRYNNPPLKLPCWLSNLKKLELLDLMSEIVEFPNVALEMDSLRHIYARRISAPMITDSWKNIETLKHISLVDWLKSSIRLMEDCRIRELGITLESSKLDAMSFGILNNLVKLELRWFYGYPFDEACIPHHLINLTKLKLLGVMRICPSASMFPPNLTHLTLEHSNLEEDPMQELGKLLKLLYLKLNCSYRGKRIMILRNSFPRLKVMRLRRLNLLRRIDVEEGGMPQLKQLQIHYCGDLDSTNLSNKSYELEILTGS